MRLSFLPAMSPRLLSSNIASTLVGVSWIALGSHLLLQVVDGVDPLLPLDSRLCVEGALNHARHLHKAVDEATATAGKTQRLSPVEMQEQEDEKRASKEGQRARPGGLSPFSSPRSTPSPLFFSLNVPDREAKLAALAFLVLNGDLAVSDLMNSCIRGGGEGKMHGCRHKRMLHRAGGT